MTPIFKIVHNGQQFTPFTKWAVGIIFTAGIMYGYIREIPGLRGDVKDHEKRIIRVEEKLNNIEDGINFLVRRAGGNSIKP